MLPFTIYSILVVTLFRPRTVEFSDRVHLRPGIALQHEKRFVIELTTTDVAQLIEGRCKTYRSRFTGQ